jgi:hypothetical protein
LFQQDVAPRCGNEGFTAPWRYRLSACISRGKLVWAEIFLVAEVADPVADDVRGEVAGGRSQEVEGRR